MFTAVVSCCVLMLLRWDFLDETFNLTCTSCLMYLNYFASLVIILCKIIINQINKLKMYMITSIFMGLMPLQCIHNTQALRKNLYQIYCWTHTWCKILCRHLKPYISLNRITASVTPPPVSFAACLSVFVELWFYHMPHPAQMSLGVHRSHGTWASPKHSVWLAAVCSHSTHSDTGTAPSLSCHCPPRMISVSTKCLLQTVMLLFITRFSLQMLLTYNFLSASSLGKWWKLTDELNLSDTAHWGTQQKLLFGLSCF